MDEKYPPLSPLKTGVRGIATVEEAAAGIVFLASPAAGNVTSSVLDVNGGYLA
ncbi:hypothetical protein [Rhizobium jaguaris]|uniref:hypothetical protein n=1 Tax=Rhizobium jaguaris TaxID=1312183 RepID=UPI0019692304|nr:hypothetical protein [Rhizobium jaguaris]